MQFLILFLGSRSYKQCPSFDMIFSHITQSLEKAPKQYLEKCE